MNPSDPQFATTEKHTPMKPTRVRHVGDEKHGSGWAVSYSPELVFVIWDNWITEQRGEPYSGVNHESVEPE